MSFVSIKENTKGDALKLIWGGQNVRHFIEWIRVVFTCQTEDDLCRCRHESRTIYPHTSGASKMKTIKNVSIDAKKKKKKKQNTIGNKKTRKEEEKETRKRWVECISIHEWIDKTIVFAERQAKPIQIYIADIDVVAVIVISVCAVSSSSWRLMM